jgi:hypothetical protein
MPSPVIKWIEETVSGKTFCDIGGIGMNSQNERISIAVRAGADNATMIDYRRFGFPEWVTFERLMAEKDIDYTAIDNANLEDKEFPSKVGQYDVVHSTGIIYHAPSPMSMLDNLSKITKKYLITNTIIIPDIVETEAGTLRYEGSQVLFLPGISEDERAILELYYQELLGWPEKLFTTYAPRICDTESERPWLQTRAASDKHFWGEKGALSYSPYWWLFTKQAFRAAVQLFGFKIRDEHSYKGHTLALFCERIPV